MLYRVTKTKTEQKNVHAAQCSRALRPFSMVLSCMMFAGYFYKFSLIKLHHSKLDAKNYIQMSEQK